MRTHRWRTTALFAIIAGGATAVLGFLLSVTRNLVGPATTGNCGLECERRLADAEAAATLWRYVGLAGVALVLVGLVIRAQKPASPWPDGDVG